MGNSRGGDASGMNHAQSDVRQPVEVRSGKLSVRPGSYGSGWSWQRVRSKPPGKRPGASRAATWQAVTQVNLTRMAPKDCCGRRPAFGTGKAAVGGPRTTDGWDRPARRGVRGRHVRTDDGATRETRRGGRLLLPTALPGWPAAGVGGGCSTVEAGESRWREGPLVLECFRRRRGSGRLA